MQQFQDELSGTIVFVHQHAEEIPPGGAKDIVQSGKLDHVDAVFGNHLWTLTPFGHVETRKGAFMAGTDRFEITIKGKGGHGAYPHVTKDAIVIGSEVVSQLQNIISRRIDPLQTAVITVGIFEAGTSFNVIAEQAKLTGTVRYLDANIQQVVREEMERVVKGICEANGANYELDYFVGYPPLVNHDKETDIVFEAASKVEEIKEAVEVNPQMGGEDFAYYVQAKPGAFFFTGAQKETDNYPHHHPKFDFDERAMPIAAKMLISAYFTYQEKHP